MASQLNGETFAPFLAASKLPVLVDFYQDSCVPCRRVAPLIAKAEGEYDGKLAVARVNLTQNCALAQSQEVAAAPTLILYRNGQEIARHRGVIDKNGLKEFLFQAVSEE